MSSIEKLYLFLISLFFVLIHSAGFFFWDNVVQLSVPANFYYDHNFKFFFLPDEIATGHQPFVGYYLALGWKIFGRTLLVSHLLMLPFVYGILHQFYRFISKFISNKDYVYFTLFLTVLDACLLSQLSLLTFEIVHLFFLLWAVNSFLENKQTTLTIAFIGLCLVSLRSTMSAIGLFIFSFYYFLIIKRDLKLKNFLPFIPGFILFAVFLITFYIEKGWIIHNTVSNNWSKSAEYADFSDFIRNNIIIAKNFIDFGRGFILISTLIIIYKLIRDKKWSYPYHVILGLSLTQFIIFYCTTVIYKNSISIRYFLPVSIFLSVFFFVWVFKNFKYKNVILFLTLISTINGYFWAYPVNIATGWDCTPSHWNYYSLRTKMNQYITEHKIAENEVGTFFPNENTFKIIELSSNDSDFSNVDFKNNEYILFSNVYNTDDETIKELSDIRKWRLKKQFSKGNVFISLYQKVRR